MSFFFSLNIVFVLAIILANSVDLDEMPDNVAFQLRSSLPKYSFRNECTVYKGLSVFHKIIDKYTNENEYTFNITIYVKV